MRFLVHPVGITAHRVYQNQLLRYFFDLVQVFFGADMF